MELNNKIREFINKNLQAFENEAQFSDSDNIFALGFVNSLFAMKLVAFVEATFTITVEDTDLNLDNFNSVDNIAKFINRKILYMIMLPSKLENISHLPFHPAFVCTEGLILP